MDKAGEYRVYKRFERTKPDGTIVKLRIQDMPEENFPDVVDLTMNHFMVDEPVHRSTGIYLNEEAKAEYYEILIGLMGEHQPLIVICCEDEDPVLAKKVAGASIMQKATKMTDLSVFSPQTKEVAKLLEVGATSFYNLDPVKDFKVDMFYDDVLIVVHSDYRRLGIAYEFVHTRRVICKEDNVPVALAWMSAIGTQKAGAADNWEVVREVSYEDLAKKHDLVFDNAPPTTKLMLGWPRNLEFFKEQAG